MVCVFIGRYAKTIAREKEQSLGKRWRMEAKIKKKEFIRYDEGAERYSMSKHSFMKLAQEAHAVYKINRITLVSVPIFEEYLESFRV